VDRSCARFHTCTFQSRTLSPAAIRPGLVKRRGGRFRLLLATKRALRPDPALPEKMRLTDVCNRLTTRAPCEPFDSRLRLRRPCGLLRAPTRGFRNGLHLGGASLDGDPPASALDAHRIATQLIRGRERLQTPSRQAGPVARFSPRRVRTRYRSVLAGAAIDGPSGGIPRPRCFRPRAELAT